MVSKTILYLLFMNYIYFSEENTWHYASENSSFPTPHTGQTKSSGRSSNAVPGSMPLSGSPTAGSYSQPHVSHTYFFIMFLFLVINKIITYVDYLSSATCRASSHEGKSACQPLKAGARSFDLSSATCRASSHKSKSACQP